MDAGRRSSGTPTSRAPSNDTDLDSKKESSPLGYAKLYADLGFAVIPLKPREKRPLIEWKRYQEEKPSIEELETWWSKWPNANVGIITGRISGNLVVLDIDGSECFDRVKPLLGHLLDETWVVKTGRGFHIYLWLDDMVEPPRTKPKLLECLDVKGEGGYVVAPPSLHPSGSRYTFLRGPPEIPRPVSLTAEEWETLLKRLSPRVSRKDGSQQRYLSEFRQLPDSSLIRIKESLLPAWKEGQRQYLALFMSGWMAKARIHPVSVAKLFKFLADEARDPELEERLSTIYYSYRKMWGDNSLPLLEELDKLIERWKTNGVLKRNVSRGTTYEGMVKGKSGVQEILEESLGEERALEVVREIESVLGVASPYRDSIATILDYEKQLYALANLRKLLVVRARRDGNGMVYKERITIGAPTHLRVYINPLGGITKYEVVWEAPTRKRPLVIGPANMEDLIARLRFEGLILNNRLAKDVIPAIIDAFIAKGRAEIRDEIDRPGFYFIENRLTNVKWEPRIVSRAELREALILLDTLARWYGRVRDRFSTVVKWGAIAPFIYARKQLGRQYQVPHLILYGARDTGKTTLAEIATIYMWGLSKTLHSTTGSHADTEARLARVLSTSTFPVIINEANSIFTRPGVINILKNSVEDLLARGRYGKGGIWEEFPALAPLIITLNPAPPVDFASLELVPKTALLLEFTEGDRITHEKEVFNETVVPQLPKLEAIGHFIARRILDDPELLKEKWDALAERLLEEAYREVGLEPPEWLKDTYHVKTIEEFQEERIERIRSKLIRYINDTYARYVGRTVVTTNDYGEPSHNVPLDVKLKVLLDSQAIPFIIPGSNGVYYITTGVLTELSLDVASLKDLAALLGWAYIPRKKVKRGSRVTTNSVIQVNLEEFVAFLEARGE